MALDKSIHELDESLLLDDQLEIPFSQDNGGTWTTFKAKLTALALKIIKTITYTDLTTSSKTVEGAINEVNGKWLSGTLTAGATTITFSDSSITTNSLFRLFIDTDYATLGYESVSVSSGSITFTFEAQNSNVAMKVQVL